MPTHSLTLIRFRGLQLNVTFERIPESLHSHSVSSRLREEHRSLLLLLEVGLLPLRCRLAVRVVEAALDADSQEPV